MKAEEGFEIWTGWGYVLAYGVLLLGLAAFAFISPLAADLAVGLFWGILLFGFGLSSLAAGFIPLEGSLRWDSIILGALALVAGFLAITQPLVAALSLVMILGAYLLAAGIFGSVMAMQSSYHRGWRLLVSLLDLGLGALLLFVFDPPMAAQFLAISVGLSFIARGVFLIRAALALRRVEKGGSVAL